MIVYTPEEAIQQYYEDKIAVNQSSLKNLRYGVATYVEKLEEEQKETQYFKIGNAVDTLLTSDNFYGKYAVVNADTSLSLTETNIIKRVYEIIFVERIFDPDFEKSDNLQTYAEVIEKAIVEADWQRNWKMETRINKIIEKGSDYFSTLVSTQGKIILTEEEAELVHNCADRIRNTMSKDKIFSDKDDVQIIYQLPIYFKYTNSVTKLDCKSLLDMVVIKTDDENKKIDIYPFDFKTTSSSMKNFEENFWKFGYNFQADYYQLALETGFTDQLKAWYPEYSIEIHNIEFITVSTNTNEFAIRFRYPFVNSDNAKDWLNRLIWHIENDVWNVDKEFYENNLIYDIQQLQ